MQYKPVKMQVVATVIEVNGKLPSSLASKVFIFYTKLRTTALLLGHLQYIYII